MCVQNHLSFLQSHELLPFSWCSVGVGMSDGVEGKGCKTCCCYWKICSGDCALNVGLMIGVCVYESCLTLALIFQKGQKITEILCQCPLVQKAGINFCYVWSLASSWNALSSSMRWCDSWFCTVFIVWTTLKPVHTAFHVPLAWGMPANLLFKSPLKCTGLTSFCQRWEKLVGAVLFLPSHHKQQL